MAKDVLKILKITQWGRRMALWMWMWEHPHLHEIETSTDRQTDKHIRSHIFGDTRNKIEPSSYFLRIAATFAHTNTHTAHTQPNVYVRKNMFNALSFVELQYTHIAQATTNRTPYIYYLPFLHVKYRTIISIIRRCVFFYRSNVVSFCSNFE